MTMKVKKKMILVSQKHQRDWNPHYSKRQSSCHAQMKQSCHIK